MPCRICVNVHPKGGLGSFILSQLESLPWEYTVCYTMVYYLPKETEGKMTPQDLSISLMF